MTPPKKYRVKTARDYLREMYNQNDARAAFHFEKAHGTDAERLLRSIGLSERLADTMTAKEEEVFIASFSQLKPGRTSLTLPERLTIVWLLKNKFTFGGVWPNITDQGADFFSQYPLEGGRARAGGNVSDIFVSAVASKTPKGVSIAIDGSYFHQKVATAARDVTQDLLLRSQGYRTERIKDVEVYQSGVLDARMRQIMGL